METDRQKAFIQNLLSHADVRLNGDRPWDITVHNEALYARLISGGSLAFGESYMDGWWDSPELDATMKRIIEAHLSAKVINGFESMQVYFSALLSNHGSKERSFEIGEKHYDIGNDFFKVMLDKRLVYTCAYWDHSSDLDSAQEAKLDLVCRKLGLKAGQIILDIGCGWGSFAKFAAENYGVKVVGITVSKEQAELAKEMCKGLDVEIRLQDYRDVNEKFDHVVSLGMFEHVGKKNYDTYMKKVRECLNEEGLFLLHTIGVSKDIGTDPWISKYIFPGGYLPAVKDIAKALEDNFVMEDWHNLGPNYDKTLCAWYENFEKHWPLLKEKYDEHFYRMWKYYLLSCAGAFRARELQLWQIVLSKKGIEGGYRSIR